MKKILIVLKHLSIGGAEKMFLRILDNIDTSKYNIHIMLVFNQQVQTVSPLPNIKISSIFSMKSEEAKALIRYHPQKVYKEHIMEQYDVEIAFLEGYPTQIISASSNPKSKKIAFIHTDFRFFHHSLNAFSDSNSEMIAYQKYTQLLFVSNATCAGFNTVYPTLSSKEKHIFYPPLKEEMLPLYTNHLELPNEKPYFITLTRLASEKGLFKLVDACKKITKAGFDVRFKIFGIGPLYDELRKKIQLEHLEENVLLMGYCATPYNELKNSLAYICPSDNESFCIAIEEALFLSVPIIACRCPGTEEILHHGDFGLLVDNSAEGLSNGIYNFISNPVLLKLLTKKSKNGKNYWQNILKSANDFSSLFLPYTNI